MTEKMRYMWLVAGVLAFGSLWGLLECSLGDYVGNAGLPSGVIMTGFVAFGIMTMSRMLYQQRGMQLGMGLLAGALKFLHPIGGCMICSALAIAVEGALFEIIWASPRLRLNRLDAGMAVSMGVISGFVLYSGGYVATQILTPVVTASPLALGGIPGLLPSVFSSATLAALAGGLTLGVVRMAPGDAASRLTRLRKEVYFPLAMAVAVLSWTGILLLP
ncbi:MAG: hypothetical protein PHU95_00960 [Candidatus Thermoplasmatota archaeon]|nr:hypothetical protein [Candidatus Thermoplasmatota archaeon]